jgi:hypothetical protein
MTTITMSGCAAVHCWITHERFDTIVGALIA